jgi:hypothetical protein
LERERVVIVGLFMIHASFRRAALTTVLVLAIAVGGGSALKAAPPGADEHTEQAPPANSGESLSDRLDRNKGVINPPPTGDADIETTVPNPDPGTTRVIPPPGTPGGDQSVEPK